MVRVIGRPVLLLLVLLATGTSHAQQDPCVTAVDEFGPPGTQIAAGNVFGILNGQQNSGCILGPTDTSGLKSRYQTLFSGTATATSKAIARTELFDLAIEQFAGMQSSICSGPSVTGCMVGRHVNNIGKLRVALAGSVTDPTEDIVKLDSWAIRPDSKIAVSDINLNAYLTQECAAGVSDAQCHSAIALSGSFMRTSIAMNQAIVAFRLPTIEANAEFLSMRDKEWDAYFNTVSVQFPWELGINSRRFTKANKDQLGNFPRAPNSKFIVLHPSLGFEHIETPLGEKSTSAAVFLELFGYERWQWRDGSARNRWGLSAVASYANIPGMDSVGYGFLLYTPIKNITIGAVRRDGDAGSETGIVLNINLATLLEDYKNGDLGDFLTP